MEFDEVREYLPGDDVRDMDWKVTARYDKPFVKRFREERELTVLIAVDISGSQQFGSTKVKSETAAEIAALIAFSAMKNNDKAGLILFSDSVERYIRPAKGRRHMLSIISSILSHQPQSHKTSLVSALEHLNRVHRKRAVVFLISDFFDTGYEQQLSITNRRHDLIAVNIFDLAETKLPRAGIIPVIDPESGAVSLIDTFDARVRSEFEKKAAERMERTRKRLRSAAVDSVEIESGDSYIPQLVRFFAQRR